MSVVGAGRRSRDDDAAHRELVGGGPEGRVRVLHVINQLGARAGAETSLRDIIEGTARRGIDHGIVVLQPESTIVFPGAIRVYRPERATGRLAQLRRVCAAIDDFDPDTVHTSLFEADLIGRLAALVRRRPVLTSLVNTPYGPRAVSTEPVARWKIEVVRRVDRVLARNATSAFHAISSATAQHATDELGVDPRSIRLVPRGRSADLLGERSPTRYTEVRARFGWGDEPVVVNVARQEPQKGHVLLVDAMSRVLERHPDAKLVLVGRRGRATDTLRGRVCDLGIGDAVVELGERTDVPDLLAAADVFAFASLYEGLGGAVIEAAGIGVPVVAFDVPAVAEVLGPEHPWLVPTGDPSALADAVAEVLRDRSSAADVGRRQRERFVARYELERCLRDMASLYRDVAAASRRSANRSFARPRKLDLRG
jgi:glycosyltransferase involved in cell wall biosynthesis